jgi:hypothetical protein
MDMIAVRNPSDRTWLGAGDEDGPGGTVALDLPAGAEKVQCAAGFQAEATTLVGRRLRTAQPLRPGLSQFRVDYVLPPAEGLATFRLEAPAPTERVMVFVPAEAAGVRAEGLQPGEVFNVRGNPARAYTAAQVPADASVAVVLPLPTPQAATNGPATADGWGSAELLAVIGGGALLLLAVLVLSWRPRRRMAPGATGGE